MSETAPEELFIARKREGDDADGFAELRAAGIRHIEALSGERWSDYNPHDPGITVLEQLCYALTELIYRSGFDTADFLTGRDGKIAFEPLALHRPEYVFPCRPTTVADYRRALLDEVRSIDNVWLSGERRVLSDGRARATPGLHAITVRAGEDTVEARHDTAAAVRRAYLSRRNLCEDMLDEVVVAPTLPCELHADVEVDGTRPADDVLAEIFHVCATHIVADVHVTPLRESLDAGISLETLLSGPLTGIGPLDERRFGSDDDVVQVAELVAAVRGVESVRTVTLLWIESGSGSGSGPEEGRRHHESIPRVVDRHVLQLRVPKPGDSVCHVALSANGRPSRGSAEVVWRKYAELDFRSRERRQARTQIKSLYTAPTGTYRDFSRYHSLQNQFPNVYGIGAEGASDSGSPDERGRAAQLKGYLMLFEQLLVDHGEDTEHLAELFSTRSSAGGDTRRWRFLDGDVVPGAERVIGEETLARRFLDETMRSFDRATERRSRLYDHMLAVYGESFTQRSLKGFDHYHDHDEIERVVVENKLDYLRAVTTITRDRAAAFDYTRPVGVGADETNTSGLQHRVSLLLGFRHRHERSLVAPLAGQGHEPGYGQCVDEGAGDGVGPVSAEHEWLVRTLANDVGFEPIALDESFRRVPVSDDLGAGDRRPELPAPALVPPLRGQSGERLLVRGVRADRYRVGRHRIDAGDEDSHAVAFELENGSWRCLGTFAGRLAAERAARSLRRFLIELNVDCEGMHLLEHILLRPCDGRERHIGATPVRERRLWETFYPLRFSVLLPAWTARCRDRSFRSLVEETVSLNAPAHTSGRCLWLELDEMIDFERCHDEWLRRRRGANAAAQDVDAVALELIEQLLTYRARERHRGGD